MRNLNNPPSVYTSYKHNQQFPLQSPIRPRQKMPTIYRHKIYQKSFLQPDFNNYDANPELALKKSTNTKLKRLDHAVQKQRGQMLMKTGRNSNDDPQWMKSTFNYYKKSNFSPPQKKDLLQQRKFDILNNKKQDFKGRNQDNYFKSMIGYQLDRSQESKFSSRNSQFFSYEFPIERKMRSTLNWSMQYQRQVSPKVGALQIRDYSIKKPLLKIGKNDYINTYSPFQKF